MDPVFATGDLSVHRTVEQWNEIRRDGEPIGALAWDPVDDTVEISVQLDEIERGRRTGSAIVSALAAHLFGQGHRRLTARPALTDTASIRTYEQAGFRAVGSDSDVLVMERPRHRLDPWPWRPGGAQVIPMREGGKPGDAAPWRGSNDPIELDDLLARVARRGAGHPPLNHSADPRLSAVLIALFDGERGAEVVLTRRSWALRNHRGEVSFPGGRSDPGESPSQTALREAFEEIGLDPDHVQVVGELDHIATVVSSSVIVPVVARLDRRPDVRPMTMEVDRVLTVPLVEFLQPNTHRSEKWGLDWEHVVHFFELDDETVWGATGRLLYQLLTIATESN
jgi:8-oxo-dGTP pyrophosphatase MutT (NUDIX family)/GNAT superfamily N-acetyltransferase